MLWIKAFHIIFVITWFAALFYLPRLFVYHAMSEDQISDERFKMMEKKLYYAIMLPSAVLATGFGLWLLSLNWQAYMTFGWMHTKLVLIVALWIYQLYCGKLLKKFKNNRNNYSHVFYRWFNEIPAILLIAIVILVVIKPF